MNDKEILEALYKGSTQAFEDIYNRYYSNVFFIARRYSHSEDDAQDARSNTFLKLWQLHDKLKFNNFQSLYGWVRRITVNHCIDVSRKYSVIYEKPTDIEYMMEECTLDIPSEEEVFEISDKEAIIVERLLNRLNNLPDKFKTVFQMRCFDELKFIEISKKLHTDLSTIKKRYARAVELLKPS